MEDSLPFPHLSTGFPAGATLKSTFLGFSERWSRAVVHAFSPAVVSVSSLSYLSLPLEVLCTQWVLNECYLFSPQSPLTIALLLPSNGCPDLSEVRVPSPAAPVSPSHPRPLWKQVLQKNLVTCSSLHVPLVLLPATNLCINVDK